MFCSQLKKPIVPILAESNYRADGWLGILIGDILVFEGSND